jgi:hypothetical protein
MKKKLALSLLLISVIFASCSRYVTVAQAAAGRAHCGQYLR